MFLGIWINPWCLDWQYGMSISQKFGPWHEWGASWSYELLILKPRFGMIQSDVFVRRWKLKSPVKETEKNMAGVHDFICFHVCGGSSMVQLPMSSPWRLVFPMAPGVRIDPRLAILYRPVQGLLDHPGATAATKRYKKAAESAEEIGWPTRLFFCIDPVEQVGFGRWDATIIYNLIIYNIEFFSIFTSSPVAKTQQTLAGLSFSCCMEGAKKCIHHRVRKP